MNILRRLLHRNTRPEEEPEDLRPVFEDARLPVHIRSDDARLAIEDGNLAIETDAGRRVLRLSEISLVAMHGGASVTVPCLASLAQHGIPFLLLSRSGWYRGQLTNLLASCSSLRRSQDRVAASEALSMPIARSLVSAKIRSARHTLRRRLGARDPRVAQLKRQARRADSTRTRSRLLGIEGAAAATYWAAWPDLLVGDEAFTFGGRSRRPARDGVNAVLSYGYAVATGAAAAAAAGAGLDERVGFLHRERAGRPSLALDLVEPIRTTVVDPMVLAAVNRRALVPEHLDTSLEAGVRLTPEGRCRVLELLEARFSTEIDYRGQAMSWREAMCHYTLQLARHVRDGIDLPPVPCLA